VQLDKVLYVWFTALCREGKAVNVPVLKRLLGVMMK
jgi:hypothetical protein